MTERIYVPDDKDVKGRPAQRPGQDEVNKIYNRLIKSREYWVLHFHEHFNPEPLGEYLYNNYFKDTKDEWDCVGFNFDNAGDNGVRFVMFYKKSKISAKQLNRAFIECYDVPAQRYRFDSEHDIAYIGNWKDHAFQDSPIARKIGAKNPMTKDGNEI